jgi:hypothetical protein
MYGAPPEKTVDDPIGHLEEIDLTLSPTLTVSTLYLTFSSMIGIQGEDADIPFLCQTSR